MATPAAALLNENLQIHKGERADASRAKPLKPTGKHGLQGRKALMDVSNVPKETALKDMSTLKQRSILKEKPTLKERSTVKEKPTLKERPTLKKRSALQSQVIKNPVKIFADEETQKCHEWAKDGVEGAHFTGNDSQKLYKDMQDKRVKKKVAKVMSALHVWSDVAFDPVMFPAMEAAQFSEGVKELELEPEVLPITRCISSSGKRADAPRAKPPKASAKPGLRERKALQDVSNTLVERPALRNHEAIKNPVKIFTDEGTKRCHDWVVEGAHFTGNYSQELDKDVQEKCDKAKLAEDFFTDDELDQYPFMDNNPVKFELRDEAAISDQGAL